MTRLLEWARPIARMLLRRLYGVRVVGLEHYREVGPRALIVANHTSFLDAVLLAVFLPDRLTFAIDPRISRLWWVRAVLGFVDVLRIDPTQPLATRTLIKVLQEDRKVAVFPEGRITVTGSLMKIYEGPALVADRAGATIVPVRIAGAQFSPFSLLAGRVRQRWFPRITLTVLPPRRLRLPGDLRGRARRRAAGRQLTEIMAEMMFVTSNDRRTIFEALLEARRIHGGRHVIAEDVERKPLSYDQLVTRAFILSDLLSRDSGPGDRVGVLLPGSVGNLVTVLALQLRGRVPAMLNVTAGADGVRAACAAADVRIVYTSREFVKAAQLDDAIRRLRERTTVIFLEDVRARITVLHTLSGWVRAHLAGRLPRGARRQGADDPAVVLFTAGTEGPPKGVVLSHANLLANQAQVAATIDVSPRDLLLNALPLFHAFGLTTGTILPVLSGVKVFFYPSPLHYRIVPEVAYEIGATILFGTNTFLAGYARAAHPFDFYTMRYVFAGAERLSLETRRTWAEKFGIRILEGYGATETGPVLAVNTPMQYRAGTVGPLLPGIDHYLEPVPGLEQGGRLCVRGPNVMLGYLHLERPGVLDRPSTPRGAGWYDTGDIVTIDADGFVTIEGRAKRFAKIGAEMISLAALEQLAERVWPDARHAALSLPDARRGEQLVLLTERSQAQRADLLARARAEGISELHVPKKIITVESIPLLGAGKTNYEAARTLVERELGRLGAQAS